MLTPTTMLDDILATPQLDEPRKAYADWLDLQCDPLGEFIRVQLQLARLPASDRRFIEFERRERELLAEFEYDWSCSIAPYVDWWVFRRGFIEEISLSLTQFLLHGKELFELAPIREVHLTEVRDDLSDLAECLELGRIGYLDLSNNAVRENGMRSLAGSEHLANLRGLNLSCAGLGDGGAKALATAKFNRLEELYLSNNRITQIGAQALAAAPRLQELRVLYLRDNYLDSHAEQTLYRRFGGRVHF
jgi:uncharacterized protein (TIGR02996 family)